MNEIIENQKRKTLTLTPMNYVELAQQIVVNLRGQISQRVLSQRLGYSFNQVGKWESGVTQFRWDDFINLMEVLKIPIEQSFQQFFWVYEGPFNSTSSLITIEKTLSLNSLEKFSEFSNIKKGIKGISSPYFYEVLKALDSKQGMLTGWLTTFMDCRKIKSLRHHFNNFKLRMEMVNQDPLCIYVNAALQVQSYIDLEFHDEKLLAMHAACSIAELRKTLDLLMSHQIITYNGKKYLPCPFDFSFSSIPSAKLRGLTKHSTLLAGNRYPLNPIYLDPMIHRNFNLSSVRVAPMSVEASKKVRDLMSDFHNQIGEILKNDDGVKENVQIFLLHSFSSSINSP